MRLKISHPLLPYWHASCIIPAVDAHSTHYVCSGFINLGMMQSQFIVPIVILTDNADALSTRRQNVEWGTHLLSWTWLFLYTCLYCRCFFMCGLHQA